MLLFCEGKEEKKNRSDFITYNKATNLQGATAIIPAWKPVNCYTQELK